MFGKNKEIQNGPEITDAPKRASKPIYKNWWFWVLAVIIVFLCIPTGGSKVEKKEQSSAPSTETPKQEEATKAENQEPQSEKEPEPEKEQAIGWTTAQKNVMASAKSYLNYSGFSYQGLIEQLEFEKYSHEDAVWAADNCNADWNQEALESAKSYIDHSGFSRKGLIEQLEYEQFTAEQATYGVDNCGADWNAEAAESAASYLKHSSFSRDSLIDQLEYEGFTHDQAVYGVEQNGY